jgi:hypothetical protein
VTSLKISADLNPLIYRRNKNILDFQLLSAFCRVEIVVTATNAVLDLQVLVVHPVHQVHPEFLEGKDLPDLQELMA